MRFLNKYKLASRITSQITKTPLKVLKFNRPKWEVIKTQFKRKNKYFVKKFLATVKRKSILKARYRSVKLNLCLKTNTALQNLKLKFSKRKLKKQIQGLKPARALFPFEYKLKIESKKKSKLGAKKKSKTSILLKSKKKVVKPISVSLKKKYIPFQPNKKHTSFSDALNKKEVLNQIMKK